MEGIGGWGRRGEEERERGWGGGRKGRNNGSLGDKPAGRRKKKKRDIETKKCVAAKQPVLKFPRATLLLLITL